MFLIRAETRYHRRFARLRRCEVNGMGMGISKELPIWHARHLRQPRLSAKQSTDNTDFKQVIFFFGIEYLSNVGSIALFHQSQNFERLRRKRSWDQRSTQWWWGAGVGGGEDKRIMVNDTQRHSSNLWDRSVRKMSELLGLGRRATNTIMKKTSRSRVDGRPYNLILVLCSLTRGTINN